MPKNDLFFPSDQVGPNEVLHAHRDMEPQLKRGLPGGNPA